MAPPHLLSRRSALAFSKTFTTTAVQALPVWWLTGNLILAFNVVLLLSFVLTALGVSRLVRELTGSRPASVVSGVGGAIRHNSPGCPSPTCCIMPWLPFAVLGIVRYVRSPSAGALAFGLCVVALRRKNGVPYYLYADPDDCKCPHSSATEMRSRVSRNTAPTTAAV